MDTWINNNIVRLNKGELDNVLKRIEELTKDSKYIPIITATQVANTTILDKYNDFLIEHKDILDHIRVTIKEDEEYGFGICEYKDGTPSEVSYDKEIKKWS